MIALLAGVSLFVVLLVIWSALYQRGLLWHAEQPRAPESARFEAEDVRDRTAAMEAVPANSSGN